MAKEQRAGQMKKRKLGIRTPDLGYYLIVTDGEKTEKHYFDGLRNSIPGHLKDRLVVKVDTEGTYDMIEKVSNLAAKDAQYRERWIVLDRDQVKGFDEFVARAGRDGIQVGWSNPCIEIWFHTYFGKMPTYPDSTTCCSGFSDLFKKKTGKVYRKNDMDIYKTLCQYGDEKTAIRAAKHRHRVHLENGADKPSKMCPDTTVYRLIEEIRGKIEQ